MQCDLVMRELSAPGGIDRSALADHLSDCPSCASWSAKVEKLDRIWEATRPVEPSPEAFEAVWSRVVAQADAPPVLAFRPRVQWKTWGLRAAAMAQAAALLIGASVLLLSNKSTPVSAPTVASSNGRPAPVLVAYATPREVGLGDGRGREIPVRHASRWPRPQDCGKPAD